MIAACFLCFGLALGCIFAGRNLYHYFQLESYQFPGYFRTLRRNLLKALLPGLCMLLLLVASMLLAAALIPDQYDAERIAAGALLIAGGWAIGRLLKEKNPKKKFAVTARVKRLYCVSLVVMTAVLALFVFCVVPPDGPVSLRGRIGLSMFFLFPVLLPLWIALCGLLAWPIEKGISEMYFRDAQRILRSRPDLIRIGITGSWGKTSVKFILGTLLSEKYNTLVTPASFNTPMGVTKVIRSGLEPGHRVFVAEMGARHVGDIREMCRLVHPVIGLLTSVGPQHLDTFHTVERVAKTKYELIEALPEDGECFFADDEGICRELYEKTGKKRTLAGMDPARDDVWAENVRYSPEGSSFDLCTREKRIPCRTDLLGELNVRNIVLCAAAAFSLGLDEEQVARGIGKIRPVEHRLQLIRNPGGITFIDDAFNSNIRGAKQAFETLKVFPERRMVVTPGMVELGDREAEMNREFGKSMAGCCDEAVLVGPKRSVAIREGLEEGGFAAEHIYVVSSLEEATRLMGTLVGPGDTVLFENDLPDNYSE